MLLGPDGERLATYRKIHRFGFGAGEPLLLEAGEQIVAPSLALGGTDVVTGLADLLRPALPRAVPPARRRRGPAGPGARPRGPPPRVEAWSLLGRARAIEDQIVLVQCNTAGTHAGVTHGRPQPGGRRDREPCSRRPGEGEEVLVVDVDLAAVDDWRERFPVLADRRL